MATFVPSSTRSVAWAASASTTNGSWIVSGTNTPS
jgi:hypothetical protein